MNEDEMQPTVDRGATRQPGHELRRARERAGMEQEELATALHLPVEQVEAIEADDYAQLPPPAFVRGYLRAYAREVGLDADEIVAEFDRASGEARDPEIVLHMGEPDPAGGHGALVALVMVVLVAAIGMGAWWLQQGGGMVIETGDGMSGETSAEPAAGETADTASDATATPEDSAADEPAAPEPPPGEAAPEEIDNAAGSVVENAGGTGSEAATGTTATAAAGEEPAADEEPVAEETAGAEDAAAADPAASETGTGDAAATETADTAAEAEEAEEAAPEPEVMVAEGEQPRATSSAAQVATAAAATGPNLLVIEVDGRSWLEVFDVRGRQLAYTLYSGDEPVRLQGWAPFDVFLGNAPAVNLRFGETAIDHSAFVRSDNTARFVVDAEGASRR